MSAYIALAGSYDRLTNDVDYRAMTEYYETLLRLHGKMPKSVLDLACGTGTLSCLLAAQGYRVIGTDRSEEMLTQAYAKAMDLENRPLFVHQSMQRLRLPEPVELTVSSLDSLNYLTKPEDCRETIRRVAKSLTADGCFIFDINSEEKLRSLDGQVFLDEDDDQYCVWRATFDSEENICYYGMDLFQRQGKMWKRSFEEHAEYAYSIEQLTGYLREAGFGKIEVYGDRTLESPSAGEQRIYFYAEKGQ